MFNTSLFSEILCGHKPGGSGAYVCWENDDSSIDSTNWSGGGYDPETANSYQTGGGYDGGIKTNQNTKSVSKNNIKAQNSNENEVKYSHYGSEQVKIITDINLENFSNFDERAEVILLTRDIKIGSDREKNWGGHFQSVKMDININNTLYSFPGEFNISNVEFINMGQNRTYPL